MEAGAGDEIDEAAAAAPEEDSRRGPCSVYLLQVEVEDERTESDVAH